jgi:hypothetical protein
MVDGHRKIEQFEYPGLEEHDYSRDPARCGREHVERGLERVADCLLGWCGFCQFVPGTLQQTVGRRGADVEQSCDLRRSKRQHVAQQQHGALPRRQMLKCCHERQPDALPLLNDVCRIRWF